MLTNQECCKIVCNTLQIINPYEHSDKTERILNLGTLRPIDSTAAVDAVVAEYLSRIKSRAVKVDAEFSEDLQRWGQSQTGERMEYYEQIQRNRQEFVAQTTDRACLTYSDFERYKSRSDTELKLDERIPHTHGAELVQLIARLRLAKSGQRGGLESGRTGYQRYLKLMVPALYQKLSKDIPALVREKERRRSTYVLSAPGVGKSELLKALCLNYIQQPNYAGLVVLDPGGDMVPQMARWPELIPEGKLVYIDPALDAELVPVINPLDAERLSDREKNLLAGQVVAALGVLIEGKQGGTITTPMQFALYPAVRLLIDLPNTSLVDLQDIMRGDERLLDLGRRSPIERVANFFIKDFENVHSATKNSIVGKLGSFLNLGVLDKVLCGRTTVNLRHLLEVERKVVLVNLSKGRLDPLESTALGTLIISMVQAIAMKRVDILSEHKRPVTHLIVDECQNFVTGELKDILREARKFGLPVTLAQQELGAEMPEDLRRTVMKTTNVKVAGRSSIDETAKTGEMLGVTADEIRGCEVGQFYWQSGTAPPFKLRVRSDRLKNKGGVSWDMWAKIQDQQKRFYYRSIHEKPPIPTARSRPKLTEKNDKPTGKKKYDFD